MTAATRLLLGVVLFHAAVCLAGWASSAFTESGVAPVLAAGQLAGLLLASCALVQLLLASRAPWLERGYGLDGLARLHHRVGQVFLVPLVAHPVLVTWAYVRWSGESVRAASASLLAMDGVVGASIAAGLFLGILVYSLVQPWTSWNYHRWYVVHLAMYLAVLLAFWHQVALGDSLRANRWFAAYWWLVSGLAFGSVLVHRVGDVGEGALPGIWDRHHPDPRDHGGSPAARPRGHPRLRQSEKRRDRPPGRRGAALGPIRDAGSSRPQRGTAPAVAGRGVSAARHTVGRVRDP